MFGDDAPQEIVAYALALVQLRKVSTKLCANALAIERRATVHGTDDVVGLRKGKNRSHTESTEGSLIRSICKRDTLAGA